ncbi:MULTISPECIES: RNA-guided endonuclease TnpB family protein [Okeania]|uniref:Transposase n=1 Tax=Okeania hirsuta TaxID=1458930 RepID=A0A3N6P5S9_9CYAN|nr:MULTISPECIES: RNA-guided endonuclease TnpB family protein [Okeania]NET14489.1 IS200/IS605 family element transposase accessory protein TnpB [Okeania sp. SIO1H6]NES78651.1 IS200/IS605 family element transposase accessory protein TnpB [Okeania sp. SIO1H4]NES90389.1 IS200/IS605 family element transposase accessory protein TnpB [Okeania sp. SIO2B9]NET22141.1 IS200/IS605 family element transposase accessory protein TnpB [Okeania sp. SIO1H5]NET79621.1 IS200/IS605 family element transposase access
MYKSIRTKLKLNNKQKTLLAQHAGYTRWCYNWGLSLWNAAYKNGYKPNVRIIREVFTNHTKPLYPWMKNLSSRVYQYAFPTECCANINLGEAFKRFFQGLGKYPRFKRKGRSDSFTIDNCGKPIELNGWSHKLPFIGIVKTYEPIEATTKKITISRQAGDWYLSCSYEFNFHTTSQKIDVVGVDLGVKTLATLSDGKVFESVRAYQKFEAKLSRLQYLNRHKEVGSANWKKAQQKIARSHRKVANIRQDALHKLTTYLAKNHGSVVIEDLNVRGMLANHRLAKSIADQGFYEFRRQLGYKCEWYGSELVVVDRFFPSSKTCSNCGHVQDMPLHLRTYDCPDCGLSIDRDLNASINLRNAVGSTVNACA